MKDKTKQMQMEQGKSKAYSARQKAQDNAKARSAMQNKTEQSKANRSEARQGKARQGEA